MAEHIYIFDTTLRDGEQAPGYSMNLEEKIRMAKQLETLGVDIIEAGFAISSPGDFESVEAISKAVKNVTVASLARALKKDIDAAYNAVKGAESPRIHVFLATSDLHLQYKLKMSRDEAFERISESVRYARSLCPDVEFSLEDATRTDIDYMCRVVEEAIRCGATTINLPDTVGYATPDDIRSTMSFISWQHSKYAISGWYPASTRVSNPALMRWETPPQRTACSPKRSVSVSSLNDVTKMPALPAPMAAAYARATFSLSPDGS